MRRRSKSGDKAIKTQRRKTFAPKATSGRRSPAAGKETNVVRLTRERDEALEQQTATSDVLRVISGSRGELEVVFKAMLETPLAFVGRNLARFFAVRETYSGSSQCVVHQKRMLSSGSAIQ